MKAAPVKFHIPKPCTENWEGMLPTDQGRFCLNCQKPVVDFTQKTSEEILAFIVSNGMTCGRFNRDQMFLSHELPRTFIQRWKDYVAAASLVIGTKLMVLTPALAQTVPISVKTSFGKETDQQEEPLFNADGNLHLKGRVLDVVTKRPLTGVRISLKKASQSYLSTSYSDPSIIFNDHRNFMTVTDSSGGFELIVPAVDLGPFGYNLSFERQSYYGGGLSLENLPNKQNLVQYLTKIEHKIPESYSVSTTTMGAVAISERMVVRPGRSGKAYRTRAGVILARAISPYYRLKNLIQDRFFYS